ncbi:MAG: hypothetical protein IT373_00760 [Polyangiaceae bacterium]|nr:hypothetical protein [Polyangiaceae bacterium]
MLGYVGACTSTGSFGSGTPSGAEGGPCLPGGTCNAGLVCLSNLCVAPGTGGGGAGGEGAGGGAGATGGSGAGGAAATGGSGAGGGNGGGATGGNASGGAGGAVLYVPTVSIYHPGDGETRDVSNGAFPFSGAANDPQDGALTGGALVWTSSLDGIIGTGGPFNYLPSVGTHVITLTATDSDLNEGTASITITMVP